MEQLNNVPKELYRGVVIRYPMTDYYEYQGFDLVPPHKPIIDESGRKLTQDGNEYGVYMSDYIEVAKSAYANVSLRDGTPLNKNIVFKGEGNTGKQLIKYLALVVVSGTISGWAVTNLAGLLPMVAPVIIKIPVETILYLFNYTIHSKKLT